MLQHAPHEDEAGRTPLRRAATLAFQVPGRPDSRAAAHVDARVTEDLGERHRHRHERAIAASLERGVGSERKLADLKFLVVQHALEGLARAQNLYVEIDPFGLYATVHQRTGTIIVPARERQLEIGHQDVPAMTPKAFAHSRAPFKAPTRAVATIEQDWIAIRDRAAGRTAMSQARARSAHPRHRAGARSNDCRR